MTTLDKTGIEAARDEFVHSTTKEQIERWAYKWADDLLSTADALSSLPAQAVPQRWRDVGYLMACIDDAIEQGYDPDVDGPLLDEIRAELKAPPSQPAAVGVDELLDLLEAMAANAIGHGYLSIESFHSAYAQGVREAAQTVKAALRSTP